MEPIKGIVTDAVRAERRKHHRNGGLVIQSKGSRVLVNMQYQLALEILSQYRGKIVMVERSALIVRDETGKIIFKGGTR